MLEWLTNFVEKFYQTMIVDDRYMQIFWGLGNTLLITVCAILMGTVIGTIILPCNRKFQCSRRAACIGHVLLRDKN